MRRRSFRARGETTFLSVDGKSAFTCVYHVAMEVLRKVYYLFVNERFDLVIYEFGNLRINETAK